MTLDRLASDPRVSVRRPGTPDAEGEAIVYWMERAKRGHDNPALDLAIEIGNLLRKPVVVFFAIHPCVERANLRHYTFLAEGLADLADDLRRRRVGLALRTLQPDHGQLVFIGVGDRRRRPGPRGLAKRRCDRGRGLHHGRRRGGELRRPLQPEHGGLDRTRLGDELQS
jgi:hypothetical protein